MEKLLGKLLGKLKEEKGQAIFEILIFLPVFFFLYTVIFNVGSSINLSINQQKVARRYFYYLKKGNSFLPSNLDLKTWQNQNISYAGMSMLGFRQDADNELSIAPCFGFPNFMGTDTGETCEVPTAGEGEKETRFIKIMTAYGVCGESYILQDRHWLAVWGGANGVIPIKNKGDSCTLRL